MSISLELELIHLVLAIILSGSAVAAKIYHSGKNKGKKEETLDNLQEKVDELKEEFEAEKRQAAHEHHLIRNEIKAQQGKIDSLCSTVSELTGKIAVLIKKLA